MNKHLYAIRSIGLYLVCLLIGTAIVGGWVGINVWLFGSHIGFMTGLGTEILACLIAGYVYFYREA